MKSFKAEYGQQRTYILSDEKPMTLETVSNIEIVCADGLLVVRLDGGGKPSYQHVYRAAAGVRWDNDAGAFKFATKNDNRYAHWFAHVRKVLEQEMGVQLRLDSNVTWTNVPEGVRHEIALDVG
jgi:hypothetical protein